MAMDWCSKSHGMSAGLMGMWSIGVQQVTFAMSLKGSRTPSVKTHGSYSTTTQSGLARITSSRTVSRL